MMQCIMKGVGFQEGFAQFILHLQYMMEKNVAIVAGKQDDYL